MTDISIKPMLASPLAWEHVRYPVMVSAKVDGVRCIITGGVAYSRSGKPFPNRHLQQMVHRYGTALEGADGELYAGPVDAPDVFRVTSSAIRSQEGQPEFRLLLFDCISHPEAPWESRFRELKVRRANSEDQVGPEWPAWAEFLLHITCYTRSEVSRWESAFVADGFEGAMLRDPQALYKFGRVSAREATLLKLKRYADAEAEVIGFEEQMHNGNAAFTTPQGLTKRQTLQENKTGAGVLGSLLCRLPDGTEFGIGTGFTAGMREQLWRERDTLPGRLVTFKSMPYGVKDAPRHPVFKGFRDRADT